LIYFTRGEGHAHRLIRLANLGDFVTGNSVALGAVDALECLQPMGTPAPASLQHCG